MVQELIDRYAIEFPVNGTFVVRLGESTATIVAASSVPDAPGVYMICGGQEDASHLVYVGKAGTIRTDGSFKRQQLPGRLTATRGDQSSNAYFQGKMREGTLDQLIFRWFVTYSENSRIIPVKAEGDLLQAYFDDFSRLPDWNLSA